LTAAGLAPELAGEMGTAALIGQLALVMFVVTALVRTVQNMQKEIERGRLTYEAWVAEGRGLSHKEYEEYMKTFEAQQQLGFATIFDQYFVEREGTLRDLMQAIAAETIASWFADEGVVEIKKKTEEYYEDKWTVAGRAQIPEPGPYNEDLETYPLKVLWENMDKLSRWLSQLSTDLGFTEDNPNWYPDGSNRFQDP